MCVLIEALCLVIPNNVLDNLYAGGATAFIDEMSADPEMRYAVSDGIVTVVSMFDPATFGRVADQLQELGFVGSDDRQAVDFVCVDMETGVAVPCEWLEVARHSHGYMLAWFGGTEGGMAAMPGDWDPSKSWRLARRDVRDDSDHALMLASDDGFDIMLHFDTGRVDESLDARSPVVPVGVDDAEFPQSWDLVEGIGTVLATAQGMLQRVGIPYDVDTSIPAIFVPFVHEVTVARSADVTEKIDISQRVIITSDDAFDRLICTTLLPLCIASPLRAAAASLIERVNALASTRMLEYDESTGTVAVVTISISSQVHITDAEAERAVANASPEAGTCYEALVAWMLEIDDEAVTVARLLA